jgi:predicted DNA-binding WGR domain protein
MRRFDMTEVSPPQPSLQILLERVDPARNMARYYVLSIEPSLFGDSALVRDWGRIGSPSRRRSEFFDKHADARVVLETWLARKRRRGYVIRSAEPISDKLRR